MKLILIIVLMSVGLFAADPGEELQVAARRGQLAEVKKLLEAGAPLEGKNQYGATPLYMAVFNGHTEVAMLLLDKGANPNVTDTFYKSSILDGALQKDRTEIVRDLIGKGLTVSARQLDMVVGRGIESRVKAGGTFEVLATNSMEQVLKATPALVDGVLYMCGMQHLFAVAEKR